MEWIYETNIDVDWIFIFVNTKCSIKGPNFDNYLNTHVDWKLIWLFMLHWNIDRKRDTKGNQKRYKGKYY